eukprot:jgi/Botrbrau1/21393/Bobra.0216s0013.1
MCKVKIIQRYKAFQEKYSEFFCIHEKRGSGSKSRSRLSSRPSWIGRPGVEISTASSSLSWQRGASERQKSESPSLLGDSSHHSCFSSNPSNNEMV